MSQNGMSDLSQQPDLNQKVSFLIVTYNSQNEIADLLRDIESLPEGEYFEILVIDNASGDDTVRQVEITSSRARVIENSLNIGYGRAVNQGIAELNTEYVFVLNPDIRISDPGIIELITAPMEQSKKIGAVGPLQYIPGDLGAGLKFNWSYYSPRAVWLLFQHWKSRQVIYCRPIRSPFLNAGSILLRRAAFLQVGGFNENNFLHGEEPDLFLKFIQYGFEARLHPGVGVIHYRERSIQSLPKSKLIRTRLRSCYNVCHSLKIGSLKIALTIFQRFLRQTPLLTEK